MTDDFSKAKSEHTQRIALQRNFQRTYGASYTQARNAVNGFYEQQQALARAQAQAKPAERPPAPEIKVAEFKLDMKPLPPIPVAVGPQAGGQGLASGSPLTFNDVVIEGIRYDEVEIRATIIS